MNRREFLAALGLLGLSVSAVEAEPFGANGGNSPVDPGGDAVHGSNLIPFRISLPRRMETLPFGSSRAGAQPAFPLRGIKGYGWSERQYLRQIPILSEYKLNFLMNGYESLWELGRHDTLPAGPVNFWYKPLSAKKREAFSRVIRSSRRHGLDFCFCMNPNLRSDRPFEYGDAGALAALWRHYEWAQQLGVKWFGVSLDDIRSGVDGEAQARLANTIFERLRKRDRRAQMIFTPTWYAGTGKIGIETPSTLGAKVPGSKINPGIDYTQQLARLLASDVYLFWTGPAVASLEVNAAQVRAYKALSKHRIILWDNYPVNDRNPTLHMGPLTGRSAGLASEASGYMSNPMAAEDEANRIPLLTIADYAWNPEQYDPMRSMGQSVLHFSLSSARREALRHLSELYPGRLWDRSTATGWNSLRERFFRRMKDRSAGDPQALVSQANAALAEMQSAFPDRWSSGWGVLEQDLAAMASEMAAK